MHEGPHEPEPGGAGLPPSPAAAQPHVILKAGRFRGLGANYWKLWGSSAISNLGDGVSLIAFPWLATVLTDSAFLVALLGVATRLPWLLFSLPAGALADRLDRRRIMITMNAMRGVVVAIVAVLVHLDLMTLPLLYLAALLLGFAEVLFDNTSQVILPAVVRKDQLEAANGNLMGAQIVLNEFLGHPIGGVLTAAALALPFAVDAATAAVSVALLLAMRGSFRVAAEPGAPRATLRQDIAEGLRWLWRHRFLRPLAITLGCMNSATAGAMAIFVLFAQEILALGAVGFGIVTTALGVGGLAGSLLAVRVSQRIGQGASLFVTLAVSGLGLAVMTLTSSAIVVGVVFASYGFSAVLWNVITVSLRQTIVPDRLLGRVNSVYRLLAWGSMPLGMAAGGGLVTLVEPVLGRAPGLRAPYAAAALVHVVLIVYARGRLNQRAIDEARAAAG